MFDALRVQYLIHDMIEELTLLIGGIVATQPVNDDVVRQLTDAIRSVWSKYTQQVANHNGNNNMLSPNEKIETLLREIRDI